MGAVIADLFEDIGAFSAAPAISTLQSEFRCDNGAMLHGDSIALWVVGLIVIAAGAGTWMFSSSTRLHRRRRKSHSPIKSKTNRPMVRFSVRPPKK